MADPNTRQSRPGRMAWIIAVLVLVLLLLFVIFGFGDRTPAVDDVETAPAVSDPAPATTE